MIAQDTDDTGVVRPGLQVWTDGFRLGRAELRYKPGQAPTNCVPSTTPGAPPVCTAMTNPNTGTAVAPAPATISFGGILESSTTCASA